MPFLSGIALAAAPDAEVKVQMGKPLLDEVTNSRLQEHEHGHARVRTGHLGRVDQVVEIGGRGAHNQRVGTALPNAMEADPDPVAARPQEEEGALVHLKCGTVAVEEKVGWVGVDAAASQPGEEAARHVSVVETEVEVLNGVGGQRGEVRRERLLDEGRNHDGRHRAVLAVLHGAVLREALEGGCGDEEPGTVGDNAEQVHLVHHREEGVGL